MINRGISKAVQYWDWNFRYCLWILFWIFKGIYNCNMYLLEIHIVYNYDKWPINVDKSYTFPYLEKGSNYLLKEFPDEKTYQDSKEKIEEL